LEADAAFRAKVGVAISVTSARAVMSAFMMPLHDYEGSSIDSRNTRADGGYCWTYVIVSRFRLRGIAAK
jgi:hypothetical protein